VRGKGDESEGEGCEREKSGRVVGGLRGTRLRSHNSVCTSLSLSLSRARSLSLSRALSLCLSLCLSRSFSVSLAFLSRSRALCLCGVCGQKAKKAKKAHGLWKPLAADKLFHFKGVHFKVCERVRG